MKRFFLCLILVFFIQGISWAGNQNIDEERIYTETEVDLKPSFPGGNSAMKAFIQKKLKWPNEYGNSGNVIVSVVITKKGRIMNSRVKRTLCTFCDLEAMRVLKKMPRWLPGKLNGKRVNTEVQIPIRFEITI
ncbi:energy transducer TonB [Pedobacter gandavensis]|uniref:energy transducer TonB n=1 Tax=Pedobacter gandavensis TaxID=2679963 RepID=UPI00292E945E|nr:energy transducer TonB [Pedobacter gandavensis]